MEMSFPTEDRIMNFVEGLIRHVFKAVIDVELDETLERMTYAEAMRRFGKDAPDLRFGMEARRASTTWWLSRALVCFIDGGVGWSGQGAGVTGWRRAFTQADRVAARRHQALRCQGVGVGEGQRLQGWQGGISEVFDAGEQAAITERAGAQEGDLLLFVADREQVTNAALGNLRLHLGDELGLRPEGTFKALWVTDFPMFDEVELDNGTTRWVACHHPFTAPQADYAVSMETDPGQASPKRTTWSSMATRWAGVDPYPSTRGPRADVSVLGMPEEEQREKFGFLLDAFRFGPPPHGGSPSGWIAS